MKLYLPCHGITKRNFQEHDNPISECTQVGSAPISGAHRARYETNILIKLYAVFCAVQVVRVFHDYIIVNFGGFGHLLSYTIHEQCINHSQAA